jgi:hypothetical protein
VTVKRSAQGEKQFGQRRVTEQGMQIDDNDPQFEKAQLSIRKSFEGVANVTDQREGQNAKQLAQSFRTVEGIRIEES